MVTSPVPAKPTHLAFPGQIRPGDEVFISRDSGMNDLRALAILHLETSLGGPGPFVVESVDRNRATVSGLGLNRSVSLSLSSITRDRPLGAAPFSSLRFPNRA